jgi:diguanylate cyclase (GGDEF)-like protein
MTTTGRKRKRQETALLERQVQLRTKELEMANERLLLANRVKEEFLAHMSKELRTPLNHIIDIAGLLREGGVGEATAAQRPGLDSIFESSSRLRDIVDRILELCSIDIGMASFLPERFPVRDILDQAVDRIRPLADQCDVTIVTRCDEDLGEITADAPKVAYIIEELLTNALKFSGENSRVTLTAHTRINAVPGRGTRKYLEVTVSDEGLGIGKDDLERIFIGFETAGPAQPENGNLGMGLALVRRFVELHGGRIWADSRPGKGSAFTFIIPRDGTLPGVNATPRVMIASDDDGFLQMISHCLKEEGYEVTTAATGQDTLQRGIARPPDLFVVDISLPEMGGCTVCLRLKAHTGTRAVPVILVAPEFTREEQTKCTHAGADGFLVKPPDLGELLSKIRLLIDQKLNYESLKRGYEIAVSQARTDPLTGLANLREFWESLDREIERSRRYRRFCSLAMIDIDLFKQYNDRFGHLQGDEVLKRGAGIFREQIRTSDIVARYGGEEFIVIMPETGKEVALLVGEKLRKAFAEHPFSCSGSESGERLTISVGIATFPEDAPSARELVDVTDKALYRAKAGGRNRVVACEGPS